MLNDEQRVTIQCFVSLAEHPRKALKDVRDIDRDVEDDVNARRNT
jgi:hypothetical protein